MSHTAPEVLLRGHISKAADIYSYGITLWELFTAGHAYHGIPRALLGHQVRAAVNGGCLSLSAELLAARVCQAGSQPCAD